MDINEVIRKTVQEEVREVIGTIVTQTARQAALQALREMFSQVLEGGEPQSARTFTVDEAAKRMGAYAGLELDQAEPAGSDGPEATEGNGRSGKTFTVDEAAKRMKVTPKSVYTAIRDGRLKHSKVPLPPGMKRGPKDGKLTVVTLADLKAWRRSRK